MLTLSCPGCGAELSVDEQLAGCPIHCRHCRHEFTVPESPPVATAAAPPAWPEERRERPKRRPSRVRSILFTCGIVSFVLLLACGGLGTAIYVFFIREIEEPVTAGDRGLVITAERLAHFVPTLQPDPSRGNVRKVRHLDGSRELTYEYEAAEGDEKPLYVNHEIGVERSAEDARYAYGGLGIGTNIGLRLGGTGNLRQVERNELWRWGDDSRCVVLVNGDARVGNLFMARKGRRYFSLMIVGVYFEDRQAIQELLGPMLQRLDSYEP